MKVNDGNGRTKGDEFNTGNGTSKVGTGRQGERKRNLTAGDGTYKGDEFTTGHGTSKMGTGR
mgnify:CR=1 FL=1